MKNKYQWIKDAILIIIIIIVTIMMCQGCKSVNHQNSSVDDRIKLERRK